MEYSTVQCPIANCVSIPCKHTAQIRIHFARCHPVAPRKLYVSFRGQRRKGSGPAAAQVPTFTTKDDWDSFPKEAGLQADSTGALSEETSTAPESISTKLQRIWGGYNSLLEARPILTKSLTSLFGFMIGDILAQLITGQPYNVLRTVRLTLFGIIMDGPVGHLWYSTLDKKVYPDKPKSKRAIIAKTLCDQLVWAPAFTCVFFAFMCCLEARPHMIVTSIRQKLMKVLLTNYAVWPLAHLINFRFVPTSQRILYINACQILWSSYLSTCQAK